MHRVSGHNTKEGNRAAESDIVSCEAETGVTDEGTRCYTGYTAVDLCHDFGEETRWIDTKNVSSFYEGSFFYNIYVYPQCHHDNNRKF